MSGWTPTAAAARAAREALDVRASLPRSQRAGTLAGLARARQLAARRHVSDDTVRRMVAFFARNARFAAAPPPSKSWQAWNLWGGDAAREALEHRMACCNPRHDDHHAAAAHAALARLRMNPPTRESAEMALRRAYDEAVGQARVARFRLDKAATAAAVEDAARYAAALKHYGLEVSVPYQLVEDFAPAPSSRQPDLFDLSAGPASMPRPRAPRAEQLSMFSNPRVTPRDLVTLLAQTDAAAFGAQREIRTRTGEDAGVIATSRIEADYNLDSENTIHVTIRGPYETAKPRAERARDILRAAGYDADLPGFMPNLVRVRQRAAERHNPPPPAAGIHKIERDRENAIVVTMQNEAGLFGLLRLRPNATVSDLRAAVGRAFETLGDSPAVRLAVRYALDVAHTAPGHGAVRIDQSSRTPVQKWTPDEMMRRNPPTPAAAVDLARDFGLAAAKLDKAKPSATQRTPRSAAAFFREVMGALSGGVVGPDDVLILSYPLGVSDVITTPDNYRDPSLLAALAQLRAGASHVDLPTGQRAQLARVGPAAVLGAWKRSNPSASPAHTLARYVHGDLAHINGAKIAQIHPEDEKPMRAAIARGWLRKVAGGYMVTRAGRQAVA